MPASDSNPGPVETLVSACQSRVSGHRRKRETFFATAVALSGVCSLFLLGTRYVPVTLPVIAALFGLWMALDRWRSGRPAAYEIAQQLDRQEGLSDQLATAYFFRSAERRGISERVVDLQYELAARTVASVDPDWSFPKTVTRTQRASAWLLAAALLLFGLRASVQTQLSFEPPLASLFFGTFFDSHLGAAGKEALSAAAIEEASLPDAKVEDQDLSLEREATPEPPLDSLAEERYDPSREDLESLPEVEGLITLPLEDMEAGGLSQDASMLGDETDDPTLGDEASADLPDESEWSEEAQSLLDKLKQAFSKHA